MTKERRGIYTQVTTNNITIRIIRDCKSAWRWELFTPSGERFFACRHFEATKPAALKAALLHAGA